MKGCGVNDRDKMRRIHKRQVARLLNHLERKGMLTAELEQDIKRGYGYTFQDVEAALGHDKEMDDGSAPYVD